MAFTKENASLNGHKGKLTQERQKIKSRLAVLDEALSLPVPGEVLKTNDESAGSTIALESKVMAELKVNEFLGQDTDKDMVKVQRLKLLVDTADKLYGWSRNDVPRCLVQVGEMSLLLAKPEPAAIDVKTVAT